MCLFRLCLCELVDIYVCCGVGLCWLLVFVVLFGVRCYLTVGLTSEFGPRIDTMKNTPGAFLRFYKLQGEAVWSVMCRPPTLTSLTPLFPVQGKVFLLSLNQRGV